MKTSITALLRFSVRRPVWVLLLVAGLTLALATAIPDIELRLDARSLVPEGHPSLAAADAAAARFGDLDTVLLALEVPRGEDIYRPQALSLLTTLSEELGRLPGIEPGSVVSLATLPRLVLEDGVLDAEPLLSVGGQANAAVNGTPSPEVARRLGNETRRQALDDTFPVSRDHRMTAIVARVSPGADRGALLEAIEGLVENRRELGVTVHFTGSALAQAVLGVAAARDLLRLVPLVLLAVGLVLVLAFRSGIPALVALTEVGVSLLWTAGVLGLTGQPVFVTTLVLPVVLVAIGVADDVFGLRQAFSGRDDSAGETWPQRVERAFTEVLIPILFTSGTTVVALLSLAWVDLEPQRVLGIFGALSLVFSTLLTFTLVPAILVLAPPPRLRRSTAAAQAPGFLRWWLGTLEGRAVAVVPMVLLVGLMAALWGAGRVRLEDDWVGNLPQGSSVVVGHRAINERFAGANTLDLEIALRPDIAEEDGWFSSSLWTALGRVEVDLRRDSRVGTVLGPFQDLTRVAAGLRDEPFTNRRREWLADARKVDPAELHTSRLVLESLGRSPMVERLTPDARRAHLTLYVKDASFTRIGELLVLVKRTANRHLGDRVEVTPFGDGLVGHRTIGLLVRGQVQAIGGALLFEILLLTLLLRSLPWAFWATAPVAVSVLSVFGLLGVAGIPLGIASSMFVAVALGIGVDFATHLVARVRQEQRRDAVLWSTVREATVETGPAILISTVAVAVGFAVLGASEIQPNRLLGGLIALSLAVSGGLTLLLVPALAAVWLRLRERRGSASWPRLRALLRGFLALLALMVPLAGPPASAHPPAGDGVEVAVYNQRPLGAAGWRRVALELAQDGRVTRSYQVLQLWRREGEGIRSLFVLEEPAPLAGTSYLLIEDPTLPQGLEIHLVLAAGQRRVMRIEPSRFREGLLGSDFGYREMTWRLPVNGRRLLPVETPSEPLDGREARIVESVPADGAVPLQPGAWGRIRYHLARGEPLLLGADFFEAVEPPTSRTPERRLRFHGWHRRQGVWTPQSIRMESAAGRSSTLDLLGFRVFEREEELASELFQPSGLPAVVERVRAGRPVVEGGIPMFKRATPEEDRP